jgi:IS5 family transposase
MRAFVGIDLGEEAVRDETTICRFRHLLQKHKLGKSLLAAVNQYLHENGIKISRGTIVDATIISAPGATKNKDGKRDPEMHQTAKSQQGYFGMKAHIGIDRKEKPIHTILASAATVHDRDALPHLLHGRENRVWGDQGDQGPREVIRARGPRAQDFTNRRYRGRGWFNEVEKMNNRTKSQVRAKVEHAIGVIKRVFGFQKARYRGLAKNLHRLEVTAALANLFMVRRRLLQA